MNSIYNNFKLAEEMRDKLSVAVEKCQNNIYDIYLTQQIFEVLAHPKAIYYTLMMLKKCIKKYGVSYKFNDHNRTGFYCYKAGWPGMSIQHSVLVTGGSYVETMASDDEDNIRHDSPEELEIYINKFYTLPRETNEMKSGLYPIKSKSTKRRERRKKLAILRSR